MKQIVLRLKNRTFLLSVSLYIIILVIALFFRFVSLDTWMPLFVDEAFYFSKALAVYNDNLFFSLTTWQHTGIPAILSLLFYVQGDYCITSLRYLEAFFGLLSVMLVFIIFKKMCGLRIGFTTALILSIMPFHVFYSRLGLFYSFRLFIFLIILFLTLKLLVDSKSNKTFIFILISIIALLNFQFDSTQILWLVPYLFSFFLFYFWNFFSSIYKNRYYKLGFLKDNKKSLLIIFVALSLVLIVMFQIGSLQHFVNRIITINPEKGWEGLFGWSNISSSFWSINSVTIYVLVLSSVPIFFLSIPGCFIGLGKRKYLPIFLAMFASIFSSIWLGYYPRRLLIITPMLAFFAALSTNMIFEKVTNMAKFKVIICYLNKSIRMPKNSFIFLLILLLVSIWPLCQSSVYISDFSSQKSPAIPQVMQTIYIDEWTGGYASRASGSYITENIPQGAKIFVDLDNPIQLRSILSKYNYDICAVNDCGYGSKSSINTYNSMLKNSNFNNSYFLFLSPSLIAASASYNLPWINLVKTAFEGIEYNKNFAIYKFNNMIGLNDPEFKSQTALEGNSSSYWQKYYVGFNVFYSLNITRYNGLYLEFVADPSSITNIGLKQNLNSEWTSLKSSPLLEIHTDIVSQDPGATFRVHIELTNGSNLINVIGLYTIEEYVGLSSNSSQTIYFSETIPLGDNIITIDIVKWLTEYFDQNRYDLEDYSVKSVAVGAGSRGGFTAFYLHKVNMIFKAS